MNFNNLIKYRSYLNVKAIDKAFFLYRYIKVGLVNTLITFFLYLGLLHYMQLEPGKAYIFSVLIATICNVLLHGNITTSENKNLNKFTYISISYLLANIASYFSIIYFVYETKLDVLAFFIGVFFYQIVYFPSLYIINFKVKVK